MIDPYTCNKNNITKTEYLFDAMFNNKNKKGISVHLFTHASRCHLESLFRRNLHSSLGSINLFFKKKNTIHLDRDMFTLLSRYLFYNW